MRRLVLSAALLSLAVAAGCRACCEPPDAPLTVVRGDAPPHSDGSADPADLVGAWRRAVVAGDAAALWALFDEPSRATTLRLVDGWRRAGSTGGRTPQDVYRTMTGSDADVGALPLETVALALVRAQLADAVIPAAATTCTFESATSPDEASIAYDCPRTSSAEVRVRRTSGRWRLVLPWDDLPLDDAGRPVFVSRLWRGEVL